MPEPGEGREVAPRPAAEVEDPEGRLARDVPQQRGDVLADVVIARAGAEVFGALVVVRERAGGDLMHQRASRPWTMSCSCMRPPARRRMPGTSSGPPKGSKPMLRKKRIALVFSASVPR